MAYPPSGSERAGEWFERFEMWLNSAAFATSPRANLIVQRQGKTYRGSRRAE